MGSGLRAAAAAARWGVLLGLVAGCAGLDRQEIDALVARQEALAAGRAVLGEGAAETGRSGTPATPAAPKVDLAAALPSPSAAGPVKPAAYQAGDPPAARPPLGVPPDLPGAAAPRLKMPTDPAEREQYLNGLFPPLPPLGPGPAEAPGPEGRPLSLDDLQRIAAEHSPAVRKAVAAVDAARGRVRDAGAYPNPTAGFEHDTIQTGPAGYVGGYVDQLIKTGNKLRLQQAAAVMDLLNAELALRRARTDLNFQVRTAYFAALVARETARLGESLAGFAEEIYRTQVELTRRGIGAGYEPLQFRPFVLQARSGVTQARTRYVAAWRQLAAALGLPDMPPSELAGRADMAPPEFDYGRALARVLAFHTDVVTAQNAARQAQYTLAFEKVAVVPDVGVKVLLQKDYTTVPYQVVPSVVAYSQVPVWYQNQGAIQRARGNLGQAVANVPLTRNNLTATLAEAFGRYEAARTQAAAARQQVEDQIRVYRGLYERRQAAPAEVGFVELVTAQQGLTNYVTNYVTALGLQWTAVADVANLLQIDNLYEPVPPPPAGPADHTPPVPAPAGPGTPLPAPRPVDGPGRPPAPAPGFLPEAAGAPP